MKTILEVFHVLFLTSLLVSACRPQPEAFVREESILAKVNDTAITEDDLHMRLHTGNSNPEAREHALNEIITEELLYQKALKLGLDKDTKYRNTVKIKEQRLRDFKRAEMARRMRSTQIAASVDVNHEDVEKYYAEHEWAISTDVRLIVARFANEADARDARQTMEAGTPFEAIAGGTSAANTISGNTEFLRWDEIPVELVDAIYSLKNGEVSRVLSSKRTGICIVQVIDKRKNIDSTFERMSASIMNRLRDLRVQQAYERYIQDLRKESKIVNFEERRKGS